MIVSSSMASDIVEVLREFSDLQVEGTQSRMWLDAGLQRQPSWWTRRSLQTCRLTTTMNTSPQTSGAAAVLPITALHRGSVHPARGATRTVPRTLLMLCA